MRTPSSAPRAIGQLALPWAADPLLIVEALTAKARTAVPDSIVIPEFSILRGSSRIDLAQISTMLEGWEVKGDLDDESRLPRQVAAYGKVFDRVTLVVGHRTASRCERIVPHWWGIALATDNSIELVRQARENPATDGSEVADLLWRDELVSALRMITGRRPRESRRVMAEQLARELSRQELVALVAASIRARTAWRSAPS